MLLGLWKHECKRVIADRFTMPEDVEWFDQSIAKLVGEKLGGEHQKVVACGHNRYFVDFLRDAPEDMGIDQLQPLGFRVAPMIPIFLHDLKPTCLFFHRRRERRCRFRDAKGVWAYWVIWELKGTSEHVPQPVQWNRQGYWHGHGLLSGCYDTSDQGTVMRVWFWKIPSCDTSDQPTKTAIITQFYVILRVFLMLSLAIITVGVEDNSDAWR